MVINVTILYTVCIIILLILNSDNGYLQFVQIKKLRFFKLKGVIYIGIHKNYMRQDQDVEYMLLSIDRMRTDAISESMIQVLYCRAV